ncbi:unnamed protein product [Pseudo-nitzschia multistriata]|uniref:Uncharacterized protein n=1 Tax=Pseudo-nitzschia multistriata TaxID=183589 RepID=A0A448ZMG7_9STRA|nr:unnamed protein product [Pseudo-nitzschia multistriata]
MVREYTGWVGSMFSFYTASRLRRSVMNPAPPEEIIQLLKLALEIKHHNALASDENRRSLRILVLGGSVTAGIGCYWPDNLGVPPAKHWSIPGENCVWSYFLERLLNQVIFEGKDIVKIDNIASGGISSEFGALALEYQLFPDPDRVPDVVIYAFSANDAQEPNPKAVFYEYLQNFVAAAHWLNPCDNHAPLVILLDDFYADVPPSVALQQTGNIYMLSHWNNLMAVDYSSTVGSKVIVEDLAWAPLLSSNVQMHSGVGMHMGIAWTILYNLLDSMVNVCNDVGLQTIRPDRITENKANASKNILPREHDDHNALTIDPRISSNLEKGEPPMQHFGKVREMVKDASYVRLQLEENVNRTKEVCSELSAKGKEKSPLRCSWSWFFNKSTNFVHSAQVRNKMNEVLLFNNGWAAEGRPVAQPRSGWYSHSPNSEFAMKIENIAADLNFVVMLTMKSYSSKWVGSKLAVSTMVVKNSTTPDAVTNQASPVDWDNDDSLFYIDGFHEIKTSVHFPHKVPIRGGASPGDSVIVYAKLVGGSEFKFAGMAFCAY